MERIAAGEKWIENSREVDSRGGVDMVYSVMRYDTISFLK